jgi:L-lactate dehydrogenase
VDILTYAMQRASSYPPERVIGSGTILDTARFRFELSRRCRVDSRNIHAYIIGEHGDTEVPVWSLANVAGMRLRDYCPLCGKKCSKHDFADLFENARTAAYRIIQLKGATYYAIAMGVARLTEAVLRDEHTVMTVSTLINGYCGINDVCLSVPAIICRDGIRETIRLKLSPEEEKALVKSADTLKAVLRSVGF